MCGHHPLHGLYHYYPGDHRLAVRHADRSAVETEPLAARHAPLLSACPRCQSPLQEDFVFCPRCGAEVLAACPSCHRAARADWTHCAYCGADLVAK